MIFNTIGGGIGEYQYVETKTINNNSGAYVTISFNGAGIIFFSGHNVGTKEVNGVDVITRLFTTGIDDNNNIFSFAAPFENGIVISYIDSLSYVYYKKI